MDVSDNLLWSNRDWDPSYLSSVFEVDFYDFNDLWMDSINDMELVEAVNNAEKYCPVVEDISMEDDELCMAVNKIEDE